MKLVTILMNTTTFLFLSRTQAGIKVPLWPHHNIITLLSANDIIFPEIIRYLTRDGARWSLPIQEAIHMQLSMEVEVCKEPYFVSNCIQ